jgi:hypothetical protein
MSPKVFHPEQAHPLPTSLSYRFILGISLQTKHNPDATALTRVSSSITLHEYEALAIDITFGENPPATRDVKCLSWFPTLLRHIPWNPSNVGHFSGLICFSRFGGIEYYRGVLSIGRRN